MNNPWGGLEYRIASLTLFDICLGKEQLLLLKLEKASPYSTRNE